MLLRLRKERTAGFGRESVTDPCILHSSLPLAEVGARLWDLSKSDRKTETPDGAVYLEDDPRRHWQGRGDTGQEREDSQVHDIKLVALAGD